MRFVLAVIALLCLLPPVTAAGQPAIGGGGSGWELGPSTPRITFALPLQALEAGDVSLTVAPAQEPTMGGRIRLEAVEGNTRRLLAERDWRNGDRTEGLLSVPAAEGLGEFANATGHVTLELTISGPAPGVRVPGPAATGILSYVLR
jgi:hypothetical protein